MNRVEKKLVLVSVVVPVYNVVKYVEKCLNSLLEQSYARIEIIVVDDGSADGSGEICDRLAEKDERVRVFHKKNGGLSSARNYGIKKAKGDFVCLVDSDDYVKKDFVKNLMEKVAEGVDVVVCGYNENKPRAEIVTGKQAAARLLTKQENMEIVAWNKMYRRELFNGITYPDGQNYEDNLTTYKLLSKADKVVYVAESLYKYVERGGSITKKDHKEEKLLVRERAAKEAMSYFAGQKELYEAAEIAMLTAKLALVDFAVSGKIDKKYISEGIEWTRENKEELLKNRFLDKKLRLYVMLTTNMGGKLYVLFRKIRHE